MKSFGELVCIQGGTRPPGALVSKRGFAAKPLMHATRLEHHIAPAAIDYHRPRRSRSTLAPMRVRRLAQAPPQRDYLLTATLPTETARVPEDLSGQLRRVPVGGGAWKQTFRALRHQLSTLLLRPARLHHRHVDAANSYELVCLRNYKFEISAWRGRGLITA
jgi:hypothetical protein